MLIFFKYLYKDIWMQNCESDFSNSWILCFILVQVGYIFDVIKFASGLGIFSSETPQETYRK